MAKVNRSNTGLSLLLSLLLCNFITDLEASHQDINQPYRTGYHFRPARNWMNDPNGPMIYKGIYHLFYQYNPYGAVWDVRIVWGHSTSVDLVNWIPQPPAFHPSQPSDINGCWSGSVTILPNGKPVILYTGIDQNKSQVQNVAVPVNVSDPYLREWSKPPLNPVMTPNAVNGINPDRFRDPTTAWLGLDGEWRVIVGSSTDDRQGLAILYKSKDFFNWTQSMKPLHYEDLTGMWECPDFFPVSITGSDGVETSSFVQNETKSVLKVSLFETLHDYYTIGSYDREKDVYVPDLGFVQDVSAPRLDYGKYYASKTFYDDVKKRRILWGWVNESSPAKDDIEKGWSGLQSVPRKIWLDESGEQLVQWPIEEIETLRGTQVNWHNKLLKSGSTLQVHGVTAAQADVEVSFKVKELEKADVIEQSWTDPQKICSQENLSVKSGLGPFGLMVLASNGMEEYTSVYFRIFKSNDTNKNTKYVVLMCSDQSRSSLNEENDKITFGAFVAIDPSNQTLSLRTLIDHSIVESYGGGGRTCITSRVYPKLAIGENANIFAFNKGTQSVDVLSLSAWSLKSAQINDEGVPLYVKVNKLSSTKTQLPYDYYYLNYCKLKIWGRFSEEMSEMLEDQPCRVGCRIKVMLSLLKISGKRLMMNTELILSEQAWYMKPGFSILIGGILSFGAVFIELFFILTSIWLNQFYYIFGFLFIVFLILTVTSEENTAVLCYSQFCSEDYNWRWRPYFTSGSSSLYIFLYSIFYFFTKLEISKLVSGVLYFGYMIIVSYSIFVLTGSLGFYACLWFVRKIYSSVKID